MRFPWSFAIVAVSAMGCADEIAPPFPEGQGQAPPGGVRYPGGPYGTNKGDTIANFQFVGFPDPSSSTSETMPMQLADFYNPTGDEVFEEGSIYGAGNPKPKALLFNVGAVWCLPCQFEAETILPGHYQEVAPLGAEFLFLLADGPEQSQSATAPQLVNWTSKYDTAWPSVIDSERAVISLVQSSSLPVNIVIDTETMTIAAAAAGLPDRDSPLFSALDQLLEE